MTQQERKKKDQLTRLLSLPPSFLPSYQTITITALKKRGEMHRVAWHGSLLILLTDQSSLRDVQSSLVTGDHLNVHVKTSDVLSFR